MNLFGRPRVPATSRLGPAGRPDPVRAETRDTTVVVITHNYGRFLRQAVESVLAQTRRPRILVMDDASEDETAEVMHELLKAAGGGMDYYRAGINRGLVWMRNDAARIATTRWIVYLDADDWLAPDFMEAGEDWIEKTAGVDALTTDMYIVRDGRRPIPVRSRVPSSWTELIRRNTVVQTSFIRRELVAALGGYDPALDYEDWDFWIRLLKAGYRIGRLPGEHVFRREHGLNKSKICDEQEARRQVRAKHPRPRSGRRLW